MDMERCLDHSHMLKDYIKPLITGALVALIVIVVALMAIFDSPVKFPNKLKTIELFGYIKSTSTPPSVTPTLMPTSQPSQTPLASSAAKLATPSGTPTPTPGRISYSTAPKMKIDKNKQYSATLKTSVGDITISLNASQTPITVNNFVQLSKDGFYNNTVFHRVIKGFMIQGGDPKGDGTGGPGYKFDDEPFTGEYTRGTIAMANSGPNTNGSQFFIIHRDYSLAKNYVIFGKVTSGLETVDKIANASVTTSNSGEQSKPVTPVKVLSVTINE